MSNSFIVPSRILRRALAADAAVSGSAALLHVAGGATAASLLGLPPAPVLGSGLFMLAYAAALVALARAQILRSFWIAFVVVGNVAWADACVALWAFDIVSPTTLGTAWLSMQAVAVTALAVWQGIGWRASRRMFMHDAVPQVA
jgi:hypothetical protein